MNTQYDKEKFTECPREEATHVYFAGNVHLIAEEKQDVPWCDVCGSDIYFYAPGRCSGGFYAHLDQECAPEGGQKPLFLEEKRVDVKLSSLEIGGGVMRVVKLGDTPIVVIDFINEEIRPWPAWKGEDVIRFDCNWTIKEVNGDALKLARDIARRGG